MLYRRRQPAAFRAGRGENLRGKAMGLSVRDQAIWWSAGFALLLLFTWYLADILFPFLLGMAIGYFLDPLADRLVRLGLSRMLSAAVIMVLILLVFVLAGVLLLPTLIGELVDLLQALPGYFAQLGNFVTDRAPEGFADTLNVGENMRDLSANIGQIAQSTLDVVLQSITGIVNSMILLAIVPVVSFYILVDWDRMVEKIDSFLPRDHVDTIRELAREIDSVLSGFVRGQITVCLILAAFYGTALALAGLQFGLVVGVITGLISFIPYVGALAGGGLSIGLALFQFWDSPAWIVLVAAIFMIGQFLEGNVLVPKLVGKFVLLHPVWLLFALSGFGYVYGFTGLLMAVPLAAAIGVLVRFFLGKYREGPLYKGSRGADEG